MQGVLITIATAVILAIVAAFAAPLVVDWTAWRASFEMQASRATGQPVRIGGAIEAEILPSPRLMLQGVSIGDPTASTLTIGTLTAELGLGALMRGEIEARALTLTAPRLRLVLDRAGRLRTDPGTASPLPLRMEAIEIVDGTLDVVDERTGRAFSLPDIDLKGDLRETGGPLRLDGTAGIAAARGTLRLVLGKPTAEGMRLRLATEGTASGRALDLDGMLAFDRDVPRFEGRFSLATVGAAGTARFMGPVRMTPEAVVSEGLTAALGDGRPAEFTGAARLSLAPALAFDAVVNARAVDADAALTGARAPAEGLAALVGTFSALPQTSFPARIGLAVEQLTVGGTVVRDARLDLAGQSEGWRIDRAEARLPGQTDLRVSGTPAARGLAFDGEVELRAVDPAALLRWAAPRAPAFYARALTGPARLSARLAFGGDRFSADAIQIETGPGRLTGKMELAPGRPHRLSADLTLAGLDLDPLIAAAEAALADAAGGTLQGEVRLAGRDLKLSGLPVGALTFAARHAGGGWEISRLALDDLAGLRIEGTGRFARLTAPLEGRLALTFAGDKPDGLVPVGRIVMGAEAADILSRLRPIAGPVALGIQSEWLGTGASRIVADGTLGLLSGSAALARGASGAPEKIELAIAAADGARVLEALGVGGMASGTGPGRLDATMIPAAPAGQAPAGQAPAGQAPAGQAPAGSAPAAFDGRLTLAQTSATGKGEIRIAADGTVEPKLKVTLESGDLGRLFASLIALDAGAVPADLSFGLSRAPGAWRLEGIEGQLAGAPLSGTVTFETGPASRLTGAVRTPSVSLPRLIGLWGVRPTGEAGPAPFSAARFAPAQAPLFGLALDLTTDRLAVTPVYALTDARLRLASAGQRLEFSDVSGAIGGGTASGGGAMRWRADQLSVELRLLLDHVDAAALLAPLTPRLAPTGQVSLSLDVAGIGRSPLAIAQSLAGQGTLSVARLAVPEADPAALASVLADTASGQPPDERRTAQMFERALARGPLHLDQVETAFGIVGGVARLSPARAEAAGPAGPVRAAISGSFDIARLLMEITLSLESQEAGGSDAGGAVIYRGPVGAPERRVTAVALANAIAMRAIERETRRLEERQAPPAPPAANPPAANPAAAAPSANPPAAAPSAAPPVTAPGAGTATPAARPAPARPPERAAPARTENRPAAPAPQAPPLAPPVEVAPQARPQAVRPELDDLLYGRTPGGGDPWLRPPGSLPGQ